MFRVILLCMAVLWTAPVQASTWKLMDARGDGQLNFYDADTVEKRGDTVTVWRKMVFDDDKGLPGGVYARAEHMVFDCAKKTFQVVEMSNYDKNHKFMNGSRIPSQPTAPRVGSVADYLQQEVCNAGFPGDKPPIKDNDVYAYAKYLFEGFRKDSAPQ
jgi:hypothetical protein